MTLLTIPTRGPARQRALTRAASLAAEDLERARRMWPQIFHKPTAGKKREGGSCETL